MHNSYGILTIIAIALFLGSNEYATSVYVGMDTTIKGSHCVLTEEVISITLIKILELSDVSYVCIFGVGFFVKDCHDDLRLIDVYIITD